MSQPIATFIRIRRLEDEVRMLKHDFETMRNFRDKEQRRLRKSEIRCAKLQKIITTLRQK